MLWDDKKAINHLCHYRMMASVCIRITPSKHGFFCHPIFDLHFYFRDKQNYVVFLLRAAKVITAHQTFYLFRMHLTAAAIQTPKQRLI